MTMSFFSKLYREVTQLIGDPWTLSLLTWVPLLLFSMMWWIFSQSIPTDIRIGAVDLDKSQISRSLLSHYNSSPTLTVDDSFLNLDEGVAALRSGDIYGLVVLPDGLGKKTLLGRPPQVSGFINNQFLLIGKIVSSALLQAQGDYTVTVEVVKNMTKKPVIDMALSTAMPIGQQVTPLFNINKDYAQFLISAILPALWQILMVASTVISLGGAKRMYGFRAWLGKSPGQAMLAKMMVLSVFFWFQGLCFLAMLYVWLGWPMHGSWPMLIVAQLATVWASIGAGALLFVLARDATRALSIAASYVAPGLAFMGVTFPATDMTLPAKIWRSLMPICHYIDIQFSQVNYGAPLHTVVPQFKALSVFILPLFLVFFLTFHLAAKSQPTQTKELA